MAFINRLSYYSGYYRDREPYYTSTYVLVQYSAHALHSVQEANCPIEATTLVSSEWSPEKENSSLGGRAVHVV
jgi:hypothetical protein